jgi:hypothetical protein
METHETSAYETAYEIKLYVREESELYNPLDESMTTLNSDVIDYLVSKIEGMHLKKQVILSIRSSTSVNEERVQAAFRNLDRGES